MAIIRKLLSQNNEDNQWLKVDATQRYIVNDSSYWQFLFGPNSTPAAAPVVLKIAAELDKTTYDSIRFAAYLYNTATGSVLSLASAQFYVSLVSLPTWTDSPVYNFAAADTYNGYFYANVPSSAMSAIDFYGDDTIAIEVIATRLGQTYKDKIYVNHLGITDNVDRLRKEVEFLDITKLDE